MDVPGDLLRGQGAELLPRPRPRPVDLALDRKTPLRKRCARRRACGEDGETIHKVLAGRDSHIALSPPAPASKATRYESSTHECTSCRRTPPGIHLFVHAAEGRVKLLYLESVVSMPEATGMLLEDALLGR